MAGVEFLSLVLGNCPPTKINRVSGKIFLVCAYGDNHWPSWGSRDFLLRQTGRHRNSYTSIERAGYAGISIDMRLK